MAAEESFFKFRGRNVPLDILEDWYQKRMISSEDSVEIAESSDGPFVTYKLKTLITLYGSEFPFRRIRREQWDPYSSSSDSSSDGEFDVRLPSEPLFSQAPPENPAPIKMGGRFPPPKSSLPSPQPIMTPKVTSDTKIALKVPKPLATVAPLEREAPVEVPTTSESVAPMKEQVVPTNTTKYIDFPLYNLENEPQNNLITGVDVEREMMEIQTLYNNHRLSKYATISENNFCRRLLSAKIEDGSTCRICQYRLNCSGQLLFHLFSKNHVRQLKSRQVSLNSFEFYKEKIPRTLQHFSFDRYPLYNPKIGFQPSQIPLGVIADLFKATSEKKKCLPVQSFARFFPMTMPFPEKCELCKESLSRSNASIFKHIFTSTHMSELEKLEGIDPREIYFYYNILFIRLKMTEKPLETRKILYYQNQIPVALIDFRIDAFNLSPTCQREKELKQLKEQWSTVPKDLFEKASFNEFQHNPKIRCWYCCFANFKSRVQLFDHIFTEKHMEYLTTFGYSEEALTAVKRKFEAAMEVRKSPGPVTAPKVVAPKTAPPKTALPKNEISRVPLLDAPPSKARLANQAQFVETLRFIEAELTKEVKEVAARKLGNFKCTYCPRNLTFKTELQVLEHIIHQKHKEHMKFGASMDDLDYWKNLLEDYKKPEMQKEKSPVIVNNLTPENGSSNNPRVPLLDPSTSKLADEQTFNRMMDTARALFKSGGKAVENLVKKKFVTWKCSFCPNVVKLTTELMTFVHITCKKHCENTKNLSSLEDLEHWNNWVKNLLVEASKENSEPPVETKHVEPGPAKQHPLENASNSPRIPLLDVPPQNHSSVPRKDYKALYYTIRRAMLANPPKSNDLDKSVKCKCFFCPDSPKFKNLREVMQHVFNGGHLKNTDFRGTKEDFDYWKNILLPAKPNPPQAVPQAKELKKEQVTSDPLTLLPAKPNPPQAIKTAVIPPQTAPQPKPMKQQQLTPEPSIGLSMTKLPLFHISYVIPSPLEPNETPSVNMLRTVALNTLPLNRTELLNKKAFAVTATCPFCRTDMTHFAYWQVIQHAFSVRHLFALSSHPEASSTQNDYRFWLSFLTKNYLAVRDALSIERPFIMSPRRLGLSDTEFTHFTAAEREMIDKFRGPLDPAADNFMLIQSYAACVCCDEWTLDPVEIIQHRLSYSHIQKTRYYGKVSQKEITMFMGYVRRVQPSVLDKCNIM